jgi:hypothetical protein
MYLFGAVDILKEKSNGVSLPVGDTEFLEK